MAKGAIIYIDGNVEVKDFKTFKDYQTTVGGLVESIPFTDDTDAFINEEGKYMCAPNIFATFLAQINRRLNVGDWVSGNMIIVGKPDDDGNETDVPDWVIDLVNNVSQDEESIDDLIIKLGKVDGLN